MALEEPTSKEGAIRNLFRSEFFIDRGELSEKLTEELAEKRDISEAEAKDEVLDTVAPLTTKVRRERERKTVEFCTQFGTGGMIERCTFERAKEAKAELEEKAREALHLRS